MCSPFTVLSGDVSVDINVSSLLEQVAYSVDAQDRLGPVLASSCMLHTKPAVYQKVVLNPIFPLAGESVLIPKTDRQAQKQPCAPYWNKDKELI